MRFELLTGHVERATTFSAAFDLFYTGELPVFVMGSVPVALPTGVRTRFDPGLVAIIKEKSGLALKGLDVKGGVIDADYEDEWKVIVRVFGLDGLWIKPGQAIAQFVLIALPQVELIGDITLKDVKREGGFGSTDLPKLGKD